MIEVLPESSSSFLALKISGMVSEEDAERFGELLEALLQDEKTDSLLLDWQSLEGWAPGAKSLATWFGMHNWSTMRRVAVVAAARWEDEKTRIADIYKRAEVRLFPPAKRVEAIDWARRE